MERNVSIPARGAELPGTLALPAGARGVVLFAHGSGSSRLSPRNTAVAEYLRRSGTLGTLLFDLLTPTEDADYRTRFDISLLTERLADATGWLAREPGADGLAIGLFGASTGAAAALDVAARQPDTVSAVVSRGGRPDLAEGLPRVTAPTLLIVGGADTTVIQLNREAFALLGAEQKDIAIVPGATHLFEEPGALERVAELTLAWFERWL